MNDGLSIRNNLRSTTVAIAMDTAGCLTLSPAAPLEPTPLASNRSKTPGPPDPSWDKERPIRGRSRAVPTFRMPASAGPPFQSFELHLCFAVALSL
jgi:hypothetical protein